MELVVDLAVSVHPGQVVFVHPVLHDEVEQPWARTELDLEYGIWNMLFTEWRDDGTVEAVHHDHGQHHQHPGVVLTEPELVGGGPVDGLDVGGGGGETEVDDVPAAVTTSHIRFLQHFS